MDLLIIGASARAAAHSALRAGLRPWCADLFADADLRRVAPVRLVAPADYPQGLLAALRDAPPGPVLYTGALENRPRLIARLPRIVWGNTPAVLRPVRSPDRLAARFGARGLPCPAVRSEPPDAADGRRWLLKPRRSGGGLGIREYAGGPFNGRTHYLQERVDGPTCGGVFLGLHGGADLLGVTEGLAGVSWLHAPGYAYAGSVGPLSPAPPVRAAWEALGAALADDFGLRGLFGIDAVLRAGVPWPVEVNPRYTASVEVLERGLGVPLLGLHAAVFGGPPAPAPAALAVREVWAKGVLYARGPLTFPADGPWRAALDGPLDLDRVAFADVPAAREVIPRGRPVLTLFAAGRTAAEARAGLQRSAEALDRRLWPR